MPVDAASLAVLSAAYLAILAVNASQLTWSRRFRGGDHLRTFVRTAVYWWPVVVLGLPAPGLELGWCGVAVLAGAVPVALRFRETRLLLAAGSIGLLEHFPTRSDKYRSVVRTVLVGPSQEFFYRGMLYRVTLPWGMPVVAIISSICFVAEHVVQLKSGRRWLPRDYAVHLYVSLAGIALVWGSGGWIPAAIMHAVINAAATLLVVRAPVIGDSRTLNPQKPPPLGGERT